VIAFAKKIPRNPVTLSLISQLVRSGTSVGSNYCEADDAVSKKDFRNKIGTYKKEARETKYWFRMIAEAEPDMKNEARDSVARGQRTSFDFCFNPEKVRFQKSFGLSH
jgi:four helix bundle protein